MNTYQLEAVMTEDRYSQDMFVGVFPMDRLPKQFKTPACMIINSASSSSQGEHWLAVFIDQYGRGEFFDSYGFLQSKTRRLSTQKLLYSFFQYKRTTSVVVERLWAILPVLFITSL